MNQPVYTDGRPNRDKLSAPRRGDGEEEDLNVKRETWLALLIVLCIPALAGAKKDGPGPEQELVTVRLKGTNIDWVPEFVELVVADPATEMKKLIGRGAERRDKTSNSVFHRGVLYFLSTTQRWNARVKGHKFAGGDVLYFFRFGTPEARTAFLKRFKLRRQAELTDKDGQKTQLYVAGPRCYIILVVPLPAHYTCSMHPKIRTKQEGKCPICGMELIWSTPGGRKK